MTRLDSTLTAPDSIPDPCTTSQDVFDRDLERLNKALRDSGAVITDPDDGTTWIDPTVAPAALVDTYGRLLSYGYANRLLP